MSLKVDLTYWSCDGDKTDVVSGDGSIQKSRFCFVLIMPCDLPLQSMRRVTAENKDTVEDDRQERELSLLETRRDR